MISPDKFTSLDNSITGKISHLMREKGTEISINLLRKESTKHFSDVSEFILALDTLYVLGKIEFNADNQVISYVS